MVHKENFQRRPSKVEPPEMNLANTLNTPAGIESLLVILYWSRIEEVNKARGQLKPALDHRHEGDQLALLAHHELLLILITGVNILPISFHV